MNDLFDERIIHEKFNKLRELGKKKDSKASEETMLILVELGEIFYTRLLKLIMRKSL